MAKRKSEESIGWNEFDRELAFRQIGAVMEVSGIGLGELSDWLERKAEKDLKKAQADLDNVRAFKGA